MKKLLAITILIAAASFAHAQCSTTNPCVAVPITSPSYVSGMGATLYKCMGSATSCSLAALNTYIADPGTSSPWVGVSFPQKAQTTTYLDPEPYGALLNYAALNTPSGGAAGPVSAILIFQVPTQTQAPSLGAASLVTTGTTGPQ